MRPTYLIKAIEVIFLPTATSVPNSPKVSPQFDAKDMVARRANSYIDQVRTQLLDSVRDGNPGDRMPPERELARMLGASTLTIGRVLQELQREGHVQRIPGKGTFLSSGVLQSGVLAADTARRNDALPQSDHWDWPRTAEQPVMAEVSAHTAIFARLGLDPGLGLQQQNWEPIAVSQLERAIQHAGGKTIVVNYATTPDADIEDVMSRLRAVGANSGVVIGDIKFENENPAWPLALERWREAALPPLINICFAASANSYDTVRFDGAWGAYIAGRHLRELGHSAVAYVVPEVTGSEFNFIAERFAGLQRAFLTMPTARIELIRVPVPHNDESDVWHTAGEKAAQMFKGETRFSAVMFGNDFMAQRFMQSRRDTADSLSIVGYDDRLSSSAWGLTTVHPPIEPMVEQAALLLLRRLQQPFDEGWLDLVLKPQLVVRSSTRIVANQ